VYQDQMQGFLPRTGGTMTGIVRFDETADVGVLPVHLFLYIIFSNTNLTINI